MHQSLKFHYNNERQQYQFKWLELENYFNKINKTVYTVGEDADKIDFKNHLVCYIRIDFGLKSTKIYTTNEKIPSLFADYITLNYCDHFVLSWILSWFGCTHLQQFMNYCKKYGSVLDELTCLGASFNIFKGTIKKVTMDGNENGVFKRIDLSWKKKAYKFLNQSDAKNVGLTDNNNPQIPAEQQQQQNVTESFKQPIRLKIKLNANN